MARILLVDDEPEITAAWKQVLEADSHSVTVEHGGHLAIERLTESLYDLLILDIYMAEGDGLEVLNWLMDYKYELKVIVISGCGNCGVSYLDAAKFLGAQKTLSKPVKMTQLLETVNELLYA